MGIAFTGFWRSKKSLAATAGGHLKDNCHLNCLGLMAMMALGGRIRAASGKEAERKATQLPHPNDSVKSYYSKLSIKQYVRNDPFATQWR